MTAAAGPLLLEMLAARWAGGWQPVELAWFVRRTVGGSAGRVLVAALRIEAGVVAAADVHPAWRAQLTELGVEVPERPAPPRPDWLRHAALGAVSLGRDPAPLLDLVGVLGRLPHLQVLLPPPGRPDIALDVEASSPDAASSIDPQVLARVRALLAKAESTTFEAEAQAFTAKAHELMTRHSLEHSMVAAAAGGAGEHPTARRLLIDDPYAGAKSLLVQVIAEATRCRAVSLGSLQMSTVVGFEADLAGVEVLFTSLLVQAQTALQELARVSRPGSRERSRGFRSSFLHGFSHRIGVRLEAGRDAAVADVDREQGGALVPVLAERGDEVDDQLRTLFPQLRSFRRGGPSDSLGWHAGSDAAERAELPWAHLQPSG